MQPLYEKFRPRVLNQLVGQDKVIRQVSKILERGWGGRAWWISGKSGTGKTSLARIIAKQGADDFFISEYDSADALDVAELNDIERAMHLYGGARGGRVYIINEAHGLRKPIIRRLLGVLERLPKHVVFIFTTTQQGQDGLFEAQIDAGPLLSRCVHIELSTTGLVQVFAKNCRQIASVENMNGKALAEYVKLAKKCNCNCRAMLQAIEAGEML